MNVLHVDATLAFRLPDVALPCGRCHRPATGLDLFDEGSNSPVDGFRDAAIRAEHYMGRRHHTHVVDINGGHLRGTSSDSGAAGTIAE